MTSYQKHFDKPTLTEDYLIPREILQEALFGAKGQQQTPEDIAAQKKIDSAIDSALRSILGALGTTSIAKKGSLNQLELLGSFNAARAIIRLAMEYPQAYSKIRKLSNNFTSQVAAIDKKFPPVSEEGKSIFAKTQKVAHNVMNAVKAFKTSAQGAVKGAVAGAKAGAKGEQLQPQQGQQEQPPQKQQQQTDQKSIVLSGKIDEVNKQFLDAQGKPVKLGQTPMKDTNGNLIPVTADGTPIDASKLQGKDLENFQIATGTSPKNKEEKKKGTDFDQMIGENVRRRYKKIF